MELTRHKLLYLSLVIFTLFFPLNAAQNNNNKPVKNVTLQLKWKHQFQFAGYYAAIEKGFYRDLGIQVNLNEAAEAQNPLDAVFNGKAEFGICGSDILPMRAAGKPAVVLATVFQHSPQILLASKQSGIEHIHDLIGKRIAIAPNDAAITAYMNDEGVSLDKCIVYSHPFNVTKLFNGEVDAITAYSIDEPYIVDLADFPCTIIAPSMGGIDFYEDVLFTSERLIADDPELVENFRKASLKGWKYAMDNPEELVQIIYNKYSQRHTKEHLRFEAERLQNIIMQDVVELGYTNPGRWQSILGIYKKQQMIEPSFSTKGLLYSDYIKPSANIPWKVIALFSIVIIIIGSAAYYFYILSRKLKTAINNQISIQTELAESEQRFRAVTHSANEAIISANSSGIIVDWNRGAEKIFGYTKEEITGKTLAGIIPERFAKHHVMAMKLVEQGSTHRVIGKTVEMFGLHKNGNEFPIELSLAEWETGSGKFYTGIIRDITDRKSSEEALRVSEEQHRLLFQTAQEAIVVVQGSKASYFNPMTLELSGYSADEILSMNFTDFVYPNDRDLIVTNYKRRMAGENVEQRYRFRMVRKDQSIRWVELSGVKLNWKGQPATLNFLNDITEQKLAEFELININDELQESRKMVEENLHQQNMLVEELTETKEKLEEINSEKDKFFSIIAHDLQSPFVGFIGLTEIIAEDAGSFSAKELTEIGSDMHRSARNLFKLLKNLLEWAQMQQGSMSFQLKEFLLSDLIAENIETIHERSGQKGISIINTITEPLRAYADEKMVNSVVLNLISNAVKFTRRDGTITIKADKNDSNMVEISVSDTGVGMKKNIVDKLFKIGENTGSRGTDGELSTGLGLLLCKEFVEKQGGSIWAESEEGKGSTFSFTLRVK